MFSFSRREFLRRTLHGSSLVAAGAVVPQFVANTARAAEPGKDTVLVIIEMTGGNDGLNTVIPYADDDYHKNRPTLGLRKEQVIRVDDNIGLNPGMQGLRQLIERGSVAVLQGIGYPNPDRSHFESMDRWQAGVARLQDVKGSGWLARSTPDLMKGEGGGVPVMHIGAEKLPLACRGTTQGVFSINQEQPFELKLGAPGSPQEKARKKLLADLAAGPEASRDDSLLPFIQKRHLQTYVAVEKLQQVLKESGGPNAFGGQANSLVQKMDLITRLIERGFGTRVFYVAIDGFDTHSGQAQPHQQLLQQIGDSVNLLFQRLANGGQDKRVLVMTYSEFGRRVQENGSRGTDHGAASCMFVVGPAAKGGAITKHPSLTDLDAGDLKHHTDFRQVYATLLDKWLGVDSKTVLGEKFTHLDFIKPRA